MATMLTIKKEIKALFILRLNIIFKYKYREGMSFNLTNILIYNMLKLIVISYNKGRTLHLCYNLSAA